MCPNLFFVFLAAPRVVLLHFVGGWRARGAKPRKVLQNMTKTLGLDPDESGSVGDRAYRYLDLRFTLIDPLEVVARILRVRS